MTKIQQSKLEDLIGFVKRFMNQTASHPATERNSIIAAERKGF